MSFTLFTWSQEEACQQWLSSPVFLSPSSGVKERPGKPPPVPTPTSYNSLSLGALNPLKLNSLCISLPLLLVVTPRYPRFSGHSAFLTFYSPETFVQPYCTLMLTAWDPRRHIPGSTEGLATLDPLSVDKELLPADNGERLLDILEISTHDSYVTFYNANTRKRFLCIPAND